MSSAPGFAEYAPDVQRMPISVSVRTAVLSDIETLVSIQERAGREAHAEAYRRSITYPNRCVLVATRGAPDTGVPSVIAWAQTYHHAEADDPAPVGHYLGGVTVDPCWRRRGIAARLTQARMDWIGARASEAYYVVNPQNRASIALHQPWQFEEVARAPRLTGITFDGGVGLLMRATLSSRGGR